MYWPDGYIREGNLAICPECKEVKEGTIGWHVQHERKCEWKPAGTWFAKRLQSEIAEFLKPGPRTSEASTPFTEHDHPDMPEHPNDAYQDGYAAGLAARTNEASLKDAAVRAHKVMREAGVEHAIRGQVVDAVVGIQCSDNPRNAPPDDELVEEWERQHLWAIDKLHWALGVIRTWDMLNPAPGTPEHFSDAPFFRSMIDDVVSKTQPQSRISEEGPVYRSGPMPDQQWTECCGYGDCINPPAQVLLRCAEHIPRSETPSLDDARWEARKAAFEEAQSIAEMNGAAHTAGDIKARLWSEERVRARKPSTEPEHRSGEAKVKP